jgi:hypothetical protein
MMMMMMTLSQMYLFSGKDTAFTVKGTRDFGTTREK